MARALVDGMTSDWEPERYHDDYRESLEKVIEEKVEHPDVHPMAVSKAPKSTKVVDLVAVLQRSIRTPPPAVESVRIAHKSRPATLFPEACRLIIDSCMALREYRAKRHFHVTREPQNRPVNSRKAPRYS